MGVGTADSTEAILSVAKMKGELVKITVACKNYKGQWFCKQVAVHGIHSENCLVRDMERTMMGYSVGWYVEGLATRRKGYEDGKWYSAQNNYYDPNILNISASAIEGANIFAMRQEMICDCEFMICARRDELEELKLKINEVAYRIILSQ